MQSRPQYDLPTAVTFLTAGMGIGYLLAILFSRRQYGQSLPQHRGVKLQRNSVDQIAVSESASEARIHQTGRGADEYASVWHYQ